MAKRTRETSLEMSVSVLAPFTWPQLLKSLESPIACSNDFQVAIVFSGQGNWLYQLLMGYPRENMQEEARVTPPDSVV